MTNPYEPGVELDRADPALDRIAQRLEGYASRAGGEPPSGLTSRILAAIEDEPDPVGRWAWLATWHAPLRFVAAAGALVIVIVGALAFGTLMDRTRDIGSSSPPVPSVSASPSPTASPSTTPSPTPTVTPSPTDSASPLPTVSPLPSPTDDDDRFETPEPGETPRPVESDNSGPGGGGSSGPGGGGGSGSGSDD